MTQIITKCDACSHNSSLQGETRFKILRCVVCGFSRFCDHHELAPRDVRKARKKEDAR